MNELLLTFINDPYNDLNNFNLGYECEKIGQTAAGLSYYLRCSEFTKDTDLAYECLIRMSVCLSKQGNRDNKELTCLEHAISINPNRPEAYYIMSLYHSYRNNYLKSYMYACIGLENLSDKKLIKDIGYFHKYQLLFQKAFSGYNKGKISESKNIYDSLLKEYDIDDFYENLINNNLKQYPEKINKPIQYKKEKLYVNKKIGINVNKKIGINVGAGLGETDFLFDNYDKIYCFEPNDYCFNELKNNLYDNKFKLYNYGISDIDGYSKFNNCQHSGYSSILDFDENSEFYKYCDEIDKGFNNINNVTKIKVKRLDTFIKENNIEKINLIKIDTQGHDLNVVKSLGNKINIVDTIILECQIKNLYKNSFTKEEIINYMNSKNFKLIKEEPTSEIVADFEENLVFEKLENNMKLTILPEISINKNIPTALIIDNFYNNVDEVRKYALTLDYESEEIHGAVGFRCESGRKIYNGTKEYFEHLLNVKIQDDNKVGGWNYSTNGCFQWCSKGTRLVYHCDSQNYAGIVYLTPDAPVNCGTSLLRHKKHKIKNNKIFELDDWYESIENKDNLFTDKTPWEEVDNFGNIYNRLVLFNSYNIHAVSEYFGNNIQNSRLFQLFFFNILK